MRIAVANREDVGEAAKTIIVGVFREECSAADGHPRQSGWRSD
jgi:hypothetical protein